jgi:hypothetical protein
MGGSAAEESGAQMKSLAFLVAASLLILAARISFVAGQREQKSFEALCQSPGVRCVIQYSPSYLLAHPDPQIEILPWAWSQWTPEWLEAEQGAAIHDDCAVGSHTEIAGALYTCLHGGWRIKQGGQR